MKITNLNRHYLSGLIEMAINNYTENCSSLPDTSNLHYKFEFPVTAGGKAMVKIIFHWLSNAEYVCVDRDTDSWELKGLSGKDDFVICCGEKINELQKEVEKILERITNG